jgi:uncharacterized YccA/Bax inhibitor family protein
MKRSTLILFIDVVAFISFVFLTSTGILLHYLLPPGSGRWSSIMGLNRHDWGDIHFWISFVFFAVLAVHLVFHWRVLKNMIRGRAPEDSTFRMALGVLGLVAVLLLAAAPLLTPPVVEDGGKGYRYRGSGEHPGRLHRDSR